MESLAPLVRSTHAGATLHLEAPSAQHGASNLACEQLADDHPHGVKRRAKRFDLSCQPSKDSQYQMKASNSYWIKVVGPPCSRLVAQFMK